MRRPARSAAARFPTPVPLLRAASARGDPVGQSPVTHVVSPWVTQVQLLGWVIRSSHGIEKQGKSRMAARCTGIRGEAIRGLCGLDGQDWAGQVEENGVLPRIGRGRAGAGITVAAAAPGKNVRGEKRNTHGASWGMGSGGRSGGARSARAQGRGRNGLQTRYNALLAARRAAAATAGRGRRGRHREGGELEVSEGGASPPPPPKYQALPCTSSISCLCRI